MPQEDTISALELSLQYLRDLKHDIEQKVSNFLILLEYKTFLAIQNHDNNTQYILTEICKMEGSPPFTANLVGEGESEAQYNGSRNVGQGNYLIMHRDSSSNLTKARKLDQVIADMRAVPGS